MELRAGRYPKVDALAIRDLTREDLKILAQPRSKLRAADRFKDSHHRIARLFAAGLRHADVMAKTGYSEGRISTLHADPSFQELIATYRKQVDQAFVESQDTYFEIATSNMLKAERMIADQLDEADADNEQIPVKTLLAISRDAADRFGYGKKVTNVNVNVDFAARLERARARASTKQIDLVALPPQQASGVAAPDDRHSPAPLSTKNQPTSYSGPEVRPQRSLPPAQPQRLLRRA